MGQVISQSSRQFEWDPWGRLLRIADGVLTWEASYDAFGRRLQTRYTPGGNSTLTTTSFYDPEKEFQEIGVKYGGKTFWKIYGPSSCDAVTDETGATVVLMHNALDQLTGVVSQQGTIYTEQLPSSYGPQSAPVISQDLLSYAQSLMWHSQVQDPTGLIWIGERYYDPRGGRFLSPDSVGYPVCLDLYAYAVGDPVNYLDPDGRFRSAAYQKIKPAIIEALKNGGTGSFQQVINAFNQYSALRADNNIGRSNSYQVGSFDLPRGAIVFINGIDNSPSEALKSALQMSQYAGGAKIYGIYNATYSPPVDIMACLLGRLGFQMSPVQRLKNTWNLLSTVYGPHAKIFTLCHSAGADEVKGALESSSQQIRQKIIVLALAPSVIIPEKLCFKSYNYISRRDFVTHLDVIGKLKYGAQLHVLEPHPDANEHDHEVLSPTFAEPVEDHITDYIKNYGGIR